MTSYVAFTMGEVYPSDEPLSEWLTTLGFAMNDLALVHDRLDVDRDMPDRSFYWRRLAVSHFTEAALFLEHTARIPAVEAFVESLEATAREARAECVAVFQELRRELFATRNKATFHYPELRPSDSQAERPVRQALEELRASRGIVRCGSIREGRQLFADEVLVDIFVRAVGGVDALPAFDARIGAGTTSFIRFVNYALDEHSSRRQAQGAQLQRVEPVDSADHDKGWRVL